MDRLKTRRHPRHYKYPFVGYKHDQPLKLNLTKDQKVQIKSFVSIDDGDYSRLAKAVLAMEPVLAAIYPITPQAFWNHRSNVSFLLSISGEDGEEIPFWKCTTCWGTSWGVLVLL